MNADRLVIVGEVIRKGYVHRASTWDVATVDLGSAKRAYQAPDDASSVKALRAADTASQALVNG